VRAWIPSLTALMLFAGTASAAQAPAGNEDQFKKAVALQTAGDLEGAASAYRHFLEAHAGNVEARSNLGVVLARLGRYTEAIDAYRQALAFDASRLAVRLNLGIALYKANQLSDAARELETVLAAQPDHLQARYLQADCRLRLGEPAKTVALLEPLESSRRDDLLLAYLLGMAYLRTEQLDKGKMLIDRILRKGDSAEARLMMGVAKREMNDFVDAIEDLKRAVELNPELPTVHGLYAQALLEAGNPNHAKREFEAELARNPLDFEANLYFGVLLKEEREFDGAMKHFTVALGVRPGDIATRYQIASLQMARGETVPALAMLEAIVKEAPTFLEAHVSLATAYYRLKRREDGDRERAIIEELTSQIQAKQPRPKIPR
jgi:tetratricopeptide (TPR) repeat protein